jgi:hypothetical protein
VATTTALRLADLPKPERRRATARTALVIAAVWVVLVGVYHLLPLDRDARDIVGQLVVGILLFVAVTVWEVVRILRSRLPQLRAIEALGVLSALFLVIFSSTYLVLATANPASFTQPLDHTAALYFTITVLATVGFGDISAVSQTARILVSIQMLLDIALLASLARIVVGAARHSLGERLNG